MSCLCCRKRGEGWGDKGDQAPAHLPVCPLLPFLLESVCTRPSAAVCSCRGKGKRNRWSKDGGMRRRSRGGEEREKTEGWQGGWRSACCRWCGCDPVQHPPMSWQPPLGAAYHSTAVTGGSAHCRWWGAQLTSRGSHSLVSALYVVC